LGGESDASLQATIDGNAMSTSRCLDRITRLPSGTKFLRGIGTKGFLHSDDTK
jgi:hypothetical protein